MELALVAQGVLIVGGHDLLLQVAPSAVGPQQSQRAENHLSIGFTVINEQGGRYSQFDHLHAFLSRAHLRGRWSSGLLLAGGLLPLEQAACLLCENLLGCLPSHQQSDQGLEQGQGRGVEVARPPDVLDDQVAGQQDCGVADAVEEEC